jgi:hypothetical protein
MRLAGPEWSLRLAFVVFAVGTWLALALPRRVDSAAGERTARLTTTRGPVPDVGDTGAGSSSAWTSDADLPPDRPGPAWGRAGRGRRSHWGIGPRVVLGLRATAALRWLTGFLTFFLAFALRTEPLSDRLPPLGVIGLVVTAAGIGSTIGTSLGAVLRRLTPEVVVTAVLLVAAAGAAVGALAYGLVAVLATGLCAGLAASLGKLALDALVQREVPEEVRTSAFARSETVLQLAWVVGGGVGIALPVAGTWGLGLAALVLTGVLVLTARQAWAGRRLATT